MALLNAGQGNKIGPVDTSDVCNHIYIIPILLIMMAYVKLVRYIYRMRKNVTPVNILSRAKRQLKMVEIQKLFITDFP
ncbi:unnamed protein product [Rotaria magnacalcarata]